jgi:hypothetical protein
LFAQVYGNAGWLNLCLDSTVAPHGDILWNDPALPISDVIDYVATAYSRFYTSDRLQRKRQTIRRAVGGNGGTDYRFRAAQAAGVRPANF